jgi:hypothetical protein
VLGDGVVKLRERVLLPRLKGDKKRSSSLNSISNFKTKEKGDHLFHFPDILLYRNLISKNIIA